MSEVNTANLQGEQFSGLEIEEACRQNEFVLFVQPKLNLNDRRLVGVECLLRWYKDGAYLTPDRFLEQLRRCKYRPLVSQLVIQRGISIMAQLDEAGIVGQVSVNMDVSELTDSMIDYITQAFSAYQGNNELEIELTEHTAIFEEKQVLNRLNRLRENNIRVALDDFGTGFSNYSALDSFPFDTFKLDKSFIQTNTQLTSAVIRHLVEIAKITDKKLIIEGVETPAQIERTKGLGGSWVQGYEIGKPMGVEAFLKYVQHKELD